MYNLQDILNNTDSIYHSAGTNDSKFRDKVLLKCKDTLEKIQFELDEERKISQNLQERNQETLTQLEFKETDLAEIRSQLDIINTEYHRELAKSNDYQCEVLNLKDSLSRLQALEYKYKILTEKNSQLLHENQDLRSQIPKLEANLKTRDSVFEKWNTAITEIDDIITKNQEELKVLHSDKNISKDIVTDLTKMIREKFEIFPGENGEMTSKFSGRNSNRSRRNLLDDFDKNSMSFGAGCLGGQLNF